MAEDVVIAGLTPAGTLLDGSTLGPYRIEHQIGRGGMSIVYAATHIPLDRPVALKVLQPSLAGDQEFVERFLTEARAAARLDSPHIVPVYDSGQIGGVNYIAMKLLDGRDLRSVLRDERATGQTGLAIDRAVSIASQAAGALAYAHQHRVVHRDVKPANIYVDDNDRVTLVDFGIARALDMASSTLTGTVMGTPVYMSPEQARGDPADARSDIYSLGVVAYEMIAGRPPFQGEAHAVMRAQIYDAPPPIVDARPDVSPALAAAVQRALAKDPNERYQNASAMALALVNAADSAAARQALAEDETIVYNPGAGTGTATAATVSRPASGTQVPAVSPDRQETVVAVPAPVGLGRRLPLLPLAAGLVLAAVIVAVAWAILAGPFADPNGRLIVNSDPAGASVTVDGNNLGTTPLAAQKLRTGDHELLLNKAGYVEVKRTEQLRARQSDSVDAALTLLPAAALLNVQALVAKDVGTGPNGAITYGSLVTSVQAEEQFGMVVTLVPKFPGQPNVTFSVLLALVDSSGNQLEVSPPATATVTKDETGGHFIAFPFSFHANSDGTVPAGTYQLQFLIDNQVVVTRPITLVQ